MNIWGRFIRQWLDIRMRLPQQAGTEARRYAIGRIIRLYFYQPNLEDGCILQSGHTSLKPQYA